MRILIVGGSGYIGRLLVDHCLQLGWQVSVLDLRQPERGTRVRFLRGDRNVVSDLIASSRQDYDAVVDLIAYHHEQTKTMVKVWSGRCNRFIHLSTITVYGKLLNDYASEYEAVRFTSLDESYGAAKARCERVLEEAFELTGFPIVILRSAPLMGPGDPVSRENYFLKRLVAGETIRHPGPCGDYVLFLYVVDLVKAIVQAVVSEKAIGNAYHLAEANPPTLFDHVQAIASMARVSKVELYEIDSETLQRQGFQLYGFPYSHTTNARLSVKHAKQDLGFAQTPYLLALSSTVRWFLENGPQTLPAWPGRGTSQSLLCGTHEWLHAELEKQVDRGVITAFVPAPETALEQLTSSPRQREWIFIPYCEPPPNRVVVAGKVGNEANQVSVAMVPNSILQIVNADQPTGLAIPEWHSHWQLSAIFEAAPSSSTSAFLYSQLLQVDQDYRHGQPVPLVHFLKFRQLKLGALSANERVVITIDEKGDVLAFEEWLKRQSQDEHAWIPSLESCARVFLLNVERWLKPDAHERGSVGRKRMGDHEIPEYLAESLERLDGITPWPGKWTALFDISRLLCRAGFMGGGRFRISEPDEPLFDLTVKPASIRLQTRVLPLLFSCNERYFIAAMRDQKLFEVPRELAAAIEAARFIIDEEAAISGLSSSLAISKNRAMKIYQKGKDELMRVEVSISQGSKSEPEIGGVI